MNTETDEIETPLGTPEHIDGVPWYEAPIPRRWHRCRTQTFAWLGMSMLQRCACGASRFLSISGVSPWVNRNERRGSR